MVDTQWTIKGREFVNCNCSYGCPCQFNGLPTHGKCQAVAGFADDFGYDLDEEGLPLEDEEPGSATRVGTELAEEEHPTPPSGSAVTKPSRDNHRRTTGCCVSSSNRRSRRLTRRCG